MASPKRKLNVVRSPIAIDDLHGIWRWNAQHYSPAHADAYLRFLERSIDDLDRQYPQGKPVSGRPELRYMTIRRKAKGHGHIIVYTIWADAVYVLHVFHSAQDWQTKLATDNPAQ